MKSIGSRGIKKGYKQGETQFAVLVKQLFKLNRVDDIRKAANSKRYRDQLYREFGISIFANG